MRPTHLLPLAILVVACDGKGGADDTGTTGDGGTTADGGTADGGTADGGTADGGTSGVPPESPCADGGWGALDDPLLALHVRADGDDDLADGSGDAPFATLDAALDAYAESGKAAIFMGPGSYPTLTSIVGASSGGEHDGLALYGCGADQVTLEGIEADEQPVLYVAGATDVVIDGLHFTGARRALTIWQGASATVSNVRCSASELVCIAVDGMTTVADLSGITVGEVVPDAASGLGLGIAVTGATMSLSDAVVTGATGVGVLVHQGAATITGTEVSGVVSLSDGTLGRGVHVQSLATADISASRFANNEDAGVFAHQAIAISLRDSEISGMDGAAIPDSKATSGDGVVITDDGASYATGTFTATLTGNTIDDAARSGIVVDGGVISVTDLSDNSISGLGFDAGGTGVVIQNGAVVEAGSDGWYDADTEGVALDLNRAVLSF